MEPPSASDILAHCGVTDAQLENPCSNEDITAIAGFLVSWRTLAPHLGLDESDEEEIEEDGREEAEKKLKALRKWKSKFAHKATYKVLVEALVKANMAEHAMHVCQLVKAHWNPVSDSQSSQPISHTTDEGSEGDQGAVGGEMPQMQALAPIPSIGDRAIGALDEEQKFDLSADFADMLSDIVPLLTRAVSADTLKDYLQRYRHPISNRPYLDSSLYNECTSTKEILNILQVHCYIHPTQVRLLGRIVRKYGCDECKRLLQEYEEKIPMKATLKKRRDFPSCADVDTMHITKKVKVIVEGSPDTYGLEEVEKIKSALEDATGVSPDVIVLVQSEPGSVVLTFLVPASTAEHFVNISKYDISLAHGGILKIEIDDIVIEIEMQMPPTKRREVESKSQMLEKLSISDKEHIPPVKSQVQPWPGTTLLQSSEEHPLYGSSVPPHYYALMEGKFQRQMALGKEKLPPHESRRTAVTGDPIHGYLAEGDKRAISLAERIHQNETSPDERLWNSSVTSQGAKAIADGLRTNTSLKSLDLRRNAIGDDGVEHLAQALCINRTLRSLDLGDCGVTSQGAKAIADGLRTNTSLNFLILRCNAIGDDGVEHLAQALCINWTLQSLYLWNCGVTSQGAKAIADGLHTNTSLYALDLSRNAIGDDGAEHLAQALCVNRTLQYLFLGGCSITSQGAKAIADRLHTNTSRLFLNLRRNAIGDDGVEHLAQALCINRTLQSLSLEDCGVTSHGAKAIADALPTNTSLKSLDLSRNAIGDDGVEHLAQALSINRTLWALHLEDCGVTSQGARAIADRLPTNTSLNFLYLMRNAIGDDGVEHLAQALCSNRTLQSLALDNNIISSKGAASLVVGLQSNTSLKYLWLYGCPNISGPMKKELKEIARSKGIEIFL